MVIFNDFCWDIWTEMNWSGPQVKDSVSYELRYTLVCLSLYYSCWLLSNFSAPNKSLQAFFLTGIDVVSQNWKTQKYSFNRESNSGTDSNSSRKIFSYITDLHKRSMKMLSMQHPLLSILIWMSWSLSTHYLQKYQK